MNDQTDKEELTSDLPPELARRVREATPRAELWLYFLAALSYIVCGFALKQIFAWWWFGAAWFVAVVWFVPKIVDRLKGRSE